MDFDTRYAKLNNNQRTAVDTIDGPVMVIAGPGTGKTELLSMRAANILKQTDVLPENILCLTFTDAGSVAMKKRLTTIIGRDAYKVSVFTFHAFGQEIMNRHREYFYTGAEFAPADDLARHKIITSILDSLEYDSSMRSKMNGRYSNLSGIISAISDLKRSGLVDAELLKLLDASQTTIESAGKLLTDVFSTRINKQTLDSLTAILPQIESIEEDTPMDGIVSLKSVLVASLKHAIEEATNHPKVTPPLTEWKSQWMTHDVDKTLILKAQKYQPKLRELAYVYGEYLRKMQESELYDYDDMIMNIVHAMEVHDDLRYDLQEKYQYIMVDEFQDTNMAQMRILHNLTNNPVVEDTPNILVVGDDDQAIYGFQGAEVGNILSFRDKYKKLERVTLTENYRSVQQVLDSAREVIVQGSERLENHIPELDKTLTAKGSHEIDKLEIVDFATPHDEREWIASSIKALCDKGTSPGEIAVIARKHDDLVSLVSYLTKHDVAISYERQDNVLDDEAVTQLEKISRLIHAISKGNYLMANASLPEILSHPMWNIAPTVVWEISIEAHKNKEHWMEVMQRHDETKSLFEWLIASAGQSQHISCERMLDIIIGNATVTESYTSPFKSYFFSDNKRDTNMSLYSAHLKNLTAVREALRNHQFSQGVPKLGDFLEFLDANREANARITSKRHIGEDGSSVQLLSAHGSKGLEFEHVFIMSATDAMWGEKASGRPPAIVFPPHLRLRAYSDDYDERLRLFFVAMTRAKIGLHISYANENDSGKTMLPAGMLHGSLIDTQSIPASTADTAELESAEHAWYAPIINIPPITMRQYLGPILETYKLSATHVNNFIDLPHGGPQNFLLGTLLHFPSARGPHANFGTAIHTTLQRVHEHMRAKGDMLHEEDILSEFDKQMKKMDFTEDERRDFTRRGYDTLRAFLQKYGNEFRPTQQAELAFTRQDARLGDVHLNGKLDVVEFDKESRTAIVTDYKTGKAVADWDKGDDRDKIKAHKYRQQLMFYKLLIRQSRDWRDYQMTEGVIRYVEPDKAGQLIDLRLDHIDDEELEQFSKLITAIWNRIHNLSFPDTSKYEPTLKGILEFEKDLINE